MNWPKLSALINPANAPRKYKDLTSDIGDVIAESTYMTFVKQLCGNPLLQCQNCVSVSETGQVKW